MQLVETQLSYIHAVKENLTLGHIVKAGIRFISVVLPLPVAPITAVTSPGLHLKLTFLTAEHPGRYDNIPKLQYALSVLGSDKGGVFLHDNGLHVKNLVDSL